MGAICRLLNHKMSGEMVWNDGQHFSRCARCAADLIRGKQGWISIPKGHRVVWKDKGPADVDWSRWNEAPFVPAARRTPPARGAAKLKVVADAPERRDPESAGHDGVEGGQRRGDDRRAA